MKLVRSVLLSWVQSLFSILDQNLVNRIPNWWTRYYPQKNTETEALPVQPASTKAVASVAKDHDKIDNGINFLPECKDAPSLYTCTNKQS